MSPAVIEAACFALAALSAAAIWLLRDPNSFLSRLVDRPADEKTTDRKAHR